MNTAVRTALRCSCLLILVAACARPKQVGPQVFTLEAAPDAVFAQAIGQLSEWNMIVAHSDKETGVITTDQYVLGRGDEFLGEGAGYWADCGKELFISRAATADEFRMRCSVTLRPTEDGKTELLVQTNMSAYEEDAMGAATARCVSRGRFEAKLVEALRARLADTGEQEGR